MLKKMFKFELFKIKSNFKIIGSFRLPMILNIILFIQCTRSNHLPKSEGSIHLPFIKSNFLRFPCKVFTTNSNETIVDYSKEDTFHSFTLTTQTLQTLRLPLKLKREFFVRVSSTKLIFLPRTLDSIYLLEAGVFTVSKLPDSLQNYHLSQPYTSGLYYANNQLIFAIGPEDTKYQTHESYIKAAYLCPKICILNLKDFTFKLLGNIPPASDYQKSIADTKRLELHTLITVDDSSNIIFGFPFCNSLFQYKNDSLKEFPFEYAHNKPCKECDISSQFSQLYFDKYRAKYYLTYTICNEKNSERHQHEREWRILIFDRNLTLEKIIQIENRQFNPSKIEITKDFLWLSRDFSNHISDTSKYKLFERYAHF